MNDYNFPARAILVLSSVLTAREFFMKKICISFSIIVIIILTIAAGLNTQTVHAEYLRIHIRANSNEAVDQQVKYEIKDVVVNYLTPYIAECKGKADAINLLNSKKDELEAVIDKTLLKNGFSYKSNLAVRNEKFPTRVYGDLTLEEGFYDAVIVELGRAEGDNWWCVVYPPLCFTGSQSGIEYKSLILEIIEDFKRKHNVKNELKV